MSPCFNCVYTEPLSFTDGCCCKRNNNSFHFGMFSVCVGVGIVILAISTTENTVPESQRLTIKLDKCQVKFSTVNDQSWNENNNNARNDNVKINYSGAKERVCPEERRTHWLTDCEMEDMDVIIYLKPNPLSKGIIHIDSEWHIDKASENQRSAEKLGQGAGKRNE